MAMATITSIFSHSHHSQRYIKALISLPSICEFQILKYCDLTRGYFKGKKLLAKVMVEGRARHLMMQEGGNDGRAGMKRTADASFVRRVFASPLADILVG
ncbi:hypothetical protein ACLOJK_041045 [Asimina triloba]